MESVELFLELLFLLLSESLRLKKSLLLTTYLVIELTDLGLQEVLPFALWLVMLPLDGFSGSSLVIVDPLEVFYMDFVPLTDAVNLVNSIVNVFNVESLLRLDYFLFKNISTFLLLGDGF